MAAAAEVSASADAAAATAGKAAAVSYNYLGRSGLKVSSICLGTMTFGGADTSLPGNCSTEQAFALMDAFEAAGGNFVDTANGAAAPTTSRLHTFRVNQA